MYILKKSYEVFVFIFNLIGFNLCLWCLSSQGYGFSSGHVWMWELDCEESWVPKNWCFWTVVLEKTLVSPLACKEIQPVHPKGHQSRMFIGRTDAEAETPIRWPPHAKSWLIGKDPNAGRDRGQEEKGTTEDEMAGWHHWLDAHEFGELRELVMDRRPGALWFLGSQRVGHDWVMELNCDVEGPGLVFQMESLHSNMYWWSVQWFEVPILLCNKFWYIYVSPSLILSVSLIYFSIYSLINIKILALLIMLAL